MRVDIFKGYKGEPTKIDKQRAGMKKAATEKAKSEEAEAEAQGVHTEENEAFLGADDLRTAELQNVKHPPPNDLNTIKDDEVPN